MLPLDTYLNFNDLITSLSKMIVLSTGSEWSETMLLAKSEIYKPQGVSVDAWKFICMAFFISHVMIVNMIIMNLFVMVICDAFDLLHNPYREEVEVQIEAYKEAWIRCDFDGKGSLPLFDPEGGKRHGHEQDLEHLLKLTPAPIGVQGIHHHWGWADFGDIIHGRGRSASPEPENAYLAEKLAVIEQR